MRASPIVADGDECHVEIGDIDADYNRCGIPFEYRLYEAPCENIVTSYVRRTPWMIKACGCRWCKATLVALVKHRMTH